MDPNGRDSKEFEKKIWWFRRVNGNAMPGTIHQVGLGTITNTPKSAYASSHLQSRAQRRHRNHRNAIWSNVAVTTWRDHSEYARFPGQLVVDLGRKLQK